MIDQDLANKIKKVLLESKFSKNINLKSENEILNLSFNSLTEKYFEEGMEYRNLLLDGANEVFQYKSKSTHSLFFGIGDWDRNTVLSDSHIVLGSSNSTLGAYFFQLDLDHTSEDNEYIYILKNVSKAGGSGSYKRIYSKANHDLTNHEIYSKLIDKVNFDYQEYDSAGENWISVVKISKEDLKDEKKHSNVLSNFLVDMITFAFVGEEIRLGY